MSESVVYEQFDQAGQSTGLPQADADLRRLSEVPMEASVEIGRTGMTVGETLELHPGAIVILDRLAGEPVDLLVNGTLIARGEVVVVDEQFGLRVAEIVEGDPNRPTAPSTLTSSPGYDLSPPSGEVVDDGSAAGGVGVPDGQPVETEASSLTDEPTLTD